MSVVLILLTASLTIAIGFLIAFIWSVKSGQYDDDYTPSVRMLFETEIRKNEDPVTDEPGSKKKLPSKVKSPLGLQAKTNKKSE